MELTEAQLHYLAKYGFDQQLWESWRAGLREGRYNSAQNTLDAEILAPEAGTIQDLPKRDSERWNELQALGEAAIAKGELGLVILNGGMATRFGGVVKGTVPVLGKRSFLELRMEDVRRAQEAAGGEPIPVYLMNSFATDHATKEHCVARGHFGLRDGQLHHFTQFISVRLTPEGEVFADDEGQPSYYGPGHGDFSSALRASGCLEQFRSAGGKYLFVSNVDNLGARVHPVLLGLHIEGGKAATVEVAPKWPGDVGGAPYLVEGKLQLVEQIRYPESFDPDIVDVFNTNTLWFSAAGIDAEFDLGRYYVEKRVEGRTAVQFEHLIGELTRFLDSGFVQIKRTGSGNRFLPVKTPDDLEEAKEEIEAIYPAP